MVAPDLVNGKDIDKLIIPDDLSSSTDESTFKAFIDAKVYDKEGHLIQHHRQPMRSLTQYFLAIMSIPIQGTSQSPSANQATGILTNVLGLPSEITNIAKPGSAFWGGADITWGWSIQLGSGTQAFSPTLNSLAAPIANGTGTGQLEYSSVNISYMGTSILTLVTATNYTSDTINVTEIGLVGTVGIYYLNSAGDTTSNTYNFLLSYDTFSTAISIPPGGLVVFQVLLSFSG
jgi:hypothetical protein